MWLIRLMSDHRVCRIAGNTEGNLSYEMWLATAPDYCHHRYADPEFYAGAKLRPHIGAAR